MVEVIYILIIVGLAGVCFLLYKKNEAGKNELKIVENERDEFMSFGNGLDEYNKKTQEKKREAQAKILEMFSNSKTRVSNKDVAEKLAVSRTSAFRYLDELEKQGKLKQVGKTGVNVFYTLSN